jgi:hypothetical protein
MGQDHARQTRQMTVEFVLLCHADAPDGVVSATTRVMPWLIVILAKDYYHRKTTSAPRSLRSY